MASIGRGQQTLRSIGLASPYSSAWPFVERNDGALKTLLETWYFGYSTDHAIKVYNGSTWQTLATVDGTGAIPYTETSTGSMDFVIDEDSMATNSDTKVPTQQSVKAYVDASAGGSGLGYVLPAYGYVSPVDGATRYFGAQNQGTSGFAAIGSPSDGNRIYIPASGTVTKIYGMATQYGTAPSNETSTVSFRLNDTTDTTITSSLDLSGSSRVPFSATGLSVAVSAGNYFDIKWVMPTWSTDPGGDINFTIMVYIE